MIVLSKLKQRNSEQKDFALRVCDNDGHVRCVIDGQQDRADTMRPRQKGQDGPLIEAFIVSNARTRIFADENFWKAVDERARLAGDKRVRSASVERIGIAADKRVGIAALLVQLHNRGLG
jgi:hypothetical protein